MGSVVFFPIFWYRRDPLISPPAALAARPATGRRARRGIGVVPPVERNRPARPAHDRRAPVTISSPGQRGKAEATEPAQAEARGPRRSFRTLRARRRTRSRVVAPADTNKPEKWRHYKYLACGTAAISAASAFRPDLRGCGSATRVRAFRVDLGVGPRRQTRALGRRTAMAQTAAPAAAGRHGGPGGRRARRRPVPL